MTITYKGKKYPIRISYRAMKGANHELGRDYRHQEGNTDYEGMEALCYHAMKEGARKTGSEFDLKREEIEDVLDESLNEFIQSFVAFSQATDQTVAEK